MSTSGSRSRLETRRIRRRETRIQRRGDVQEHAILDSTESLLRQQPFSALTVADVAEAAGLSRPAVYFYFGSMTELLVALVTRTLDALMGSIESIEVAPAATPSDVLALGIRRTAESWRAKAPVLATALEHARTNPVVREQWQRLLNRGIDLYAALITWSAEIHERPPPRPAEARRHAELCMLMVGHAFHELHASPHTRADERQLESDLLLIVTRALQLT